MSDTNFEQKLDDQQMEAVSGGHDGCHDAGHAVGDAIQSVGQAIADGAEKAWDAVTSIFD